MDHNKFIAGGISGLIEISVTHPIDMIKTRIQQCNSVKRYTFGNLYTGFTPRILGVVPMRCVYWSVMDSCNYYFRDIQTIPIYFLSGMICGTAQSLIDTPIEFLKIQAIAKKQYNYHLYRGFQSTLTRNIFFAGIFNTITRSDTLDNKLITGGIAGFTASLLTQPLDYVKTYNQTYTDKTNIGITTAIQRYGLLKLMTGWQYRSLISIFSMGIGYFTYSKIMNKTN